MQKIEKPNNPILGKMTLKTNGWTDRGEDRRAELNSQGPLAKPEFQTVQELTRTDGHKEFVRH